MGATAQRRIFARVLPESQRAQTIPKFRVRRIGCDFRDCIHVESTPRGASGGVGYQKTRHAPSDKHELIK
jgi:hypothetical protein